MGAATSLTTFEAVKMSEPIIPGPSAGPTRRSVVLAGAAAWSVPAIVTASAAPAFAASPGPGALTIQPGATTVVDDIGAFYPFRFAVFAIHVGDAVPPGQLSLTVSFTGPEFFVNDPAPSGWVGSISFGPVPSPSTLTYFNTGPITAGQLVSFPDGEYFDANGNNGTFTLTASAPGLTSDSKTFMVPAHRAAQPRSGRARPTD